MGITPLTKEFITTQLSVRLGGQTIRVELNDVEIDAIIEDALVALGTWLPVKHFGVLNVSTGVQKYELDEGTYGKGIIRLTRALPTHPFYNAWPFPDPYIVSIPLHSLGDYALTYTHFKESEQMFGGSFRWDFDANTGIMMIRSTPIESGNYIYVYTDYPDLINVRGRRKWFLDYCEATAKKIIGAKYQKFTSFPGTEHQVELADLYTQGVEKIEELEESIQSASTGMTPPMLTHRQG
jgi:hypothetical protein